MFLLTIKAWNQSVTPDFQENKDEFCSILLFCCDFSPKSNRKIHQIEPFIAKSRWWWKGRSA